MPSPYRLAYDAARNRIDFAMWDRWSVEDADRWSRDYNEALARTRPGFVVVGDMTDCPVQSPEVQVVHGSLMAASIAGGMAKGALVVSEATLELQLKRLAGTADATRSHIFLTASRAEAEAVVADVTG